MIDSHSLNQLISGALVLGNFVVGLFFLRFWRVSRDRLFLFFSLAFFVMGLQRVALALTTQTDERIVFIYFIRLVAYALIITAIVDKNRGRSRQPSGPV